MLEIYFMFIQQLLNTYYVLSLGGLGEVKGGK